MRRQFLLAIAFGLILIISMANRLNASATFVFRLNMKGISNPDSVGIYGDISPLNYQVPMLMEGPDAEGFYSITVSFPDSAMGKTLRYAYGYRGENYDFVRKLKLQDQHLTTVERWGYIGGMSSQAMPSPEIAVFQADTKEEVNELNRPFVGITTDGQKMNDLFPIRKTGIDIGPIKRSVEKFLQSISKNQRDQCSFPIESNEWRRWHNIDFYNRTGISFRDLNKSQLELAFAILKESLSKKGLQKSKDIMKMEEHLAFLFNDYKTYGGDKFSLVFLGTPSDTEPWGWQLDGHHLVINYFVQADQVVMTPTFMGSEPTYIETGQDKGLRTFKAEEEKGLALYSSLSKEQKEEATVWNGKEYNFNQAEAFRDNAIIPATGISSKKFTAPQKKLLLDLIAEYVDNMKDDAARVKMEEVRAHLDETNFTWVQGKNTAGPFYYRIHSPVILIEFDHQKPVAVWDQTKPKPGPWRNHIHTVVRTPNGNDYGKDLLREHLLNHHH